MSDWEEDEWESTPPTNFANKFSNKVQEEDLSIIEERAAAAAAAAATAENLKKASIANEAQFENKLKMSKLLNETEAERKLREKKEIEEAEIDAAAELLGVKANISKSSSSNSTAGLGSIPLKTQADHTNFGKLIKERLEANKSSAFNVIAFYKSLNNVLKDANVTAKNIDDIIETLTKIKATKGVAVAAPTTSKANAKAAPAAVGKRSKKEIQQEQDLLADKFGGGNYEDQYDEYGDNYDFF